jgi:hypothetical protein
MGVTSCHARKQTTQTLNAMCYLRKVRKLNAEWEGSFRPVHPRVLFPVTKHAVNLFLERLLFICVITYNSGETSRSYENN